MKLNVLSPEGTVYEGEVNSVSLPGTEGPFTVLRDHASLIAALREGMIGYVTEEKGGKGEGRISVKSGFVVVNRNVVTLCVVS